MPSCLTFSQKLSQCHQGNLEKVCSKLDCSCCHTKSHCFRCYYACAEQGKAFNAVKSITSSTSSSNRPEQVIGNLFFRLQIEQNANKVTTGNDKDKIEVAELYSMITKIPNTFIPFESILLQTQENGKPILKEFQTFCWLDLKFVGKKQKKGLNALIQKSSLTHILKVPYCIIFTHQHCKVRTSISSNVGKNV